MVSLPLSMWARFTDMRPLYSGSLHPHPPIPSLHIPPTPGPSGSAQNRPLGNIHLRTLLQPEAPLCKAWPQWVFSALATQLDPVAARSRPCQGAAHVRNLWQVALRCRCWRKFMQARIKHNRSRVAALAQNTCRLYQRRKIYRNEAFVMES